MTRPAVIVVDMVFDNVHGNEHSSISTCARAIVPGINELLHVAHEQGWPVVFACDSFLEQDFLFKSRLRPHSIRGTTGAEPIDELEREPEDMVLPKRRLSAFFKTDLDQTLRTLDVDTVLVTGITTLFCVLATALDAVCHDLSAVIVEDCCAAPRPDLHEQLLSCYRDSALQPILRVQTLEQILNELQMAAR